MSSQTSQNNAADQRKTNAGQPERRYCVDCRFFALSASGVKEYGRCGNPNAERTESTRFIAPEFDQPPTAAGMRSHGGCGEVGKWFEAAPAKAVVA
jgi:hypothetical protein